MKNDSIEFYNFFFDNSNEISSIYIEKDKTIEELIGQYLEKKNKSNLLVDNFENLNFYYNGKKILYKNKIFFWRNFFNP